MSLVYSTYVSALQNWLVMNDVQGITNLSAVLPNIIDMAEQRIYRELDFLTTETTTTANLSAASRNLAIPSTVIVLQDANVITPAATAPDVGTRNPMQRVAASFINYVWSTAATENGTPSIPQYYALLNESVTNPTANTSNMIVAPAPDAAYQVEIIGTVRPTPLSVTNTSTFLSTYLPDLFLAASFVYAAGYQQNFSPDGSTPGMDTYWEGQYQKLKASAEVEELRKKSQSQGWTSLQPSPIATPPRG